MWHASMMRLILCALSFQYSATRIARNFERACCMSIALAASSFEFCAHLVRFRSLCIGSQHCMQLTQMRSICQRTRNRHRASLRPSGSLGSICSWVTRCSRFDESCAPSYTSAYCQPLCVCAVCVCVCVFVSTCVTLSWHSASMPLQWAWVHIQ